MLVLGNAIGEGNYSQPFGEWVNLDRPANIRDTDLPLTGDDKIINVEAKSSGMVPKGIKSINLSTLVRSSAVANNTGLSYGSEAGRTELRCYPIVANMGTDAMGIIKCNIDGDIYQNNNLAGNTITAHMLYAMSVQVN